MAIIYSYETDDIYRVSATVEYIRKRYADKYEVDIDDLDELLYSLHIRILDEPIDIDIEDVFE